MDIDYLLKLVTVTCILRCGLSQTRFRCFDCTELPSPRDCNRITECEIGEKCFVMQYVTASANVKYDMGCMSTKRCNSIPNGRRRDDTITTCMDCCNGELCNNEGCGEHLPPRQVRGPLCFDCKYLADPKACRSVTMCPKGEGCHVHSKVLDNSVLFTSGCIGLACGPVNNATSELHKNCPWCCHDDFCNDQCRQP